MLPDPPFIVDLVTFTKFLMENFIFCAVSIQDNALWVKFQNYKE